MAQFEMKFGLQIKQSWNNDFERFGFQMYYVGSTEDL